MYESDQTWREVDAYFEDALVAEDDALTAARASGTRTTMPRAEVSPNQGKLLGMLCQMADATRVLEFGTLAGYSTVWLARAVGEGGHVTTLELEEQNAEVARQNLERAGVTDRVEILTGPATESAQRLIDDAVEPYDFVFIDADKPNNPAYLRASLALTRPGAVIVIDNVVRNGTVTDSETLDASAQGVRAVVAEIARDPRLHATAIQTVGAKGWDGFLLIRRTA
ncbi:O-methyltransferase [Actinomadura sp. NEAU-AAG7]|uniref:O-methyltransferase n=1 Tax=Actinomadura sp. NEAU-AAG7 TaxID=2839640 RepID=UPI001BE401A0|nr:O-methyltransferase [Actinomadura sp. NEAU-AAG7]MBT2207286.1 O-methyltransferase [Actinomadura sp. NEAU-AAG7]